MGNSRGRLITWVLLATIVPVSARGSDTPTAQAVISISIQTVDGAVKSGLPVRVKATLTNTSSHEISFAREVSGRDCTVDVYDAHGKELLDTEMGYIWNGHVANPDPSRVSPRDLTGAMEFGKLKPGETLTWVFDAARLYKMSQPGKYTIRLQRRDPENPAITVKSNLISVRVTS